MSEIDDRGVRVPGWLLGIVSGLLTLAIAGLFAFVVDTREDVVRLETEVAAVKDTAASSSTSLSTLPVQLAGLQEQMKQVQREVAGLRADLDDKKRGR